MQRSLRCAAVLVALTSLSLVGCGGESGSTPTGGASPGSAAPAADAKPVTHANQFAGTWFRSGDLSSDPLVGVEFAPDGETVTFAVAQPEGGVREVTLPYSMLEGGRIRVTHPQFPGQSQVAALRVAGTTLSLEPETQSPIGMVGGTFDKLSGQSVTQRLQQRIAEIVAEREALREQIVAFIRQPNLVLVGDGASDARLAIDSREGGASPVAYQRVGESVIARQVQLADARDTSGAPTAVLRLGAVVGPPGAGEVRAESITLVPIRGDAGALALTTTAASLRADSDLFDGLKREYDLALQARREAIDRFHAQIGHFLLVEAEPVSANAAPEQLAFLRVDGEDAYRVASLRGNRILMPADFGGVAAVEVEGNQPRLRTGSHAITTDPQAPEMFLVADSRTARPFKKIHQMSKAEFDARRARFQEVVEGMKATPLELVGVFRQSERGYVRPARFSLTCADGKMLAGTFHSDATLLQGPISGEIEPSMLGLVLRIATPRPSPHVVPGGTFDEAGTFTLELQLDGDQPVLAGRVQPGDRNNRIELAPPSAELNAKLRQAFFDHLSAGGRFAWDRTGSTGGGDEVLSLVLAADGPDGVRGTAGFRRDRTAPVSGRLSEADGLLVLDLTVEPNPEAGTRQAGVGPMRLYLCPFEDHFQLSGHSTWTGATRTRYISYAPASQ